MARARRNVLLATLALAVAACGGEGAESDDLAARGRTVYQNVCTACHNADPAQDGSIGPAVAGASRELLEARVLRGAYPPGYTPRRPSQAMPPFPNLAGEIDALAAYLSAKPAS
jgi:mono/diheme cytochrome c family protein